MPLPNSACLMKSFTRGEENSTLERVNISKSAHIKKMRSHASDIWFRARSMLAVKYKLFPLVLNPHIDSDVGRLETSTETPT